MCAPAHECAREGLVGEQAFFSFRRQAADCLSHALAVYGRCWAKKAVHEDADVGRVTTMSTAPSVQRKYIYISCSPAFLLFLKCVTVVFFFPVCAWCLWRADGKDQKTGCANPDFRKTILKNKNDERRVFFDVRAREVIPRPTQESAHLSRS